MYGPCFGLILRVWCGHAFLTYIVPYVDRHAIYLILLLEFMWTILWLIKLSPVWICFERKAHKSMWMYAFAFQVLCGHAYETSFLSFWTFVSLIT